VVAFIKEPETVFRLYVLGGFPGSGVVLLSAALASPRFRSRMRDPGVVFTSVTANMLFVVISFVRAFMSGEFQARTATRMAGWGGGVLGPAFLWARWHRARPDE